MPAKPSWLLRIPEIIEQLKAIDTPVVDRSICERLFQVRRRRAIGLIRFFGGYQSGNALLIDRPSLVEQLTTISEAEQYAWEVSRKARLTDQLNVLNRSMKSKMVRLPVRRSAVGTTVDDLPMGFVVSPGKLTVEFANPEDLFGKLFELAQLAANDFDGVCKTLMLT